MSIGRRGKAIAHNAVKTDESWQREDLSSCDDERTPSIDSRGEHLSMMMTQEHRALTGEGSFAHDDDDERTTGVGR
jgi:hypothetical protein